MDDDKNKRYIYNAYNKDNINLARNLRKNMTEAEKKLWFQYLRFYPIRISRQKPVGEYILDFYCAKAKVAIELDGLQHYDDKNVNKDSIRTEKISKFGIEVIRIPNYYVVKEDYFEYTIDYIDRIINSRLSSLGKGDYRINREDVLRKKDEYYSKKK